MFQAIVHAPALTPGARLCVSDLQQTPTVPPVRPQAGDRLSLRYGVCSPQLGAGTFLSIAEREAMVQVADKRWRLGRCPNGNGIALPGLIAEDWFVVANDA